METDWNFHFLSIDWLENVEKKRKNRTDAEKRGKNWKTGKC